MKKNSLLEIIMGKMYDNVFNRFSQLQGRNCGTESQVLDVQAQC